MIAWSPHIFYYTFFLTMFVCSSNADANSHSTSVAVGTNSTIPAIENSKKNSAMENALSTTNYYTTKRLLQEVVSKSRPKGRNEAKEWTRALLALISVERLMGESSEAKVQFQRCNHLCADLTFKEEWQSMISWACASEEKTSKACKLKKK